MPSPYLKIKSEEISTLGVIEDHCAEFNAHTAAVMTDVRRADFYANFRGRGGDRRWSFGHLRYVSMATGVIANRLLEFYTKF